MRPIRTITLLGFVTGLLVLASGCALTSSPATPTAVLEFTQLPAQTAQPTCAATVTLTASPPVTPTASPTAIPPIRFAVIGDYGSEGPDLQKVAGLIDSHQVDFIITTGDNNYPSGKEKTIDKNIGQYFHSYIYPYQGSYGFGAETNRFFPSLGNHDWMAKDAQPYLDYFTLPGNERYYQFSWGCIDFFVLDSDTEEPDGIGVESIQAQWLQAALAASSAPWQVVYFHHAPFSSGYHGSTQYMQWPFKDWGAEVVFSGHDHHYERLMIDGLLYFIQGLSGGARYAIPDIYPGSEIRFRSKYGALFVEATPDQMSFQFITVDGEVVDTYTLFLSQQ